MAAAEPPSAFKSLNAISNRIMSNMNGKTRTKAGMSLLEKYNAARREREESASGGNGRQRLMGEGIASKVASPLQRQGGKENEMCGKTGVGAASERAHGEGGEKAGGGEDAAKKRARVVMARIRERRAERTNAAGAAKPGMYVGQHAVVMMAGAPKGVLARREDSGPRLDGWGNEMPSSTTSATADKRDKKRRNKGWESDPYPVAQMKAQAVSARIDAIGKH